MEDLSTGSESDYADSWVKFPSSPDGSQAAVYWYDGILFLGGSPGFCPLRAMWVISFDP